LDDAVNLLEEGANQQKLIEGFGKIGISWEEISRHGVARKSPFFAAQQVEAKAPEMPIGVKPGEGSIRPLDLDLFESVAVARAAANSFKRTDTNFSDMATAFLFGTGAFDPDQAANLIRRNARDRAAAAPSTSVRMGMEEIGNAKTYGDAAQAMLNNPIATFTMLVDSVLLTAPALATGMALAPAGPLIAGATRFATSGSMARRWASVAGGGMPVPEVAAAAAPRVSSACRALSAAPCSATFPASSVARAECNEAIVRAQPPSSTGSSAAPASAQCSSGSRAAAGVAAASMSAVSVAERATTSAAGPAGAGACAGGSCARSPLTASTTEQEVTGWNTRPSSDAST
jgi:hypothetical protein